MKSRHDANGSQGCPVNHASSENYDAKFTIPVTYVYLLYQKVPVPTGIPVHFYGAKLNIAITKAIKNYFKKT